MAATSVAADQVESVGCVRSQTWSRIFGGRTIHFQLTHLGSKTIYLYLGDQRHHQLNHITFASPVPTATTTTTTKCVNPSGSGVVSTRVLGGGNEEAFARRLSRKIHRPILLAMEVEMVAEEEFFQELEKYLFKTLSSLILTLYEI